MLPKVHLFLDAYQISQNNSTRIFRYDITNTIIKFGLQPGYPPRINLFPVWSQQLIGHQRSLPPSISPGLPKHIRPPANPFVFSVNTRQWMLSWWRHKRWARKPMKTQMAGFDTSGWQARLQGVLGLYCEVNLILLGRDRTRDSTRCIDSGNTSSIPALGCLIFHGTFKYQPVTTVVIVSLGSSFVF